MKKYYGCGETARRLGITIPTLRRMREESRGPVYVEYLTPRYSVIRYPVEAVEGFLAGATHEQRGPGRNHRERGSHHE